MEEARRGLVKYESHSDAIVPEEIEAPAEF
jgi:hypothetical protein